MCIHSQNDTFSDTDWSHIKYETIYKFFKYAAGQATSGKWKIIKY